MHKLQNGFNSILAILLLTCSLQSEALAQRTKGFSGELVYRISVRDTNMRQLFPDNKMLIYTNDTLTRIENYDTQFGTQILIHHLQLNKSYMLLETAHGKFAIQTNHNIDDSLPKPSRYVLKKTRGKEKLFEQKAKKLVVSHPDFDQPIEFIYLKKYSNACLNNFPESPGLLARYSLVFPDGVLDYELIHFKQCLPDRDLFGIPSDYRKVTLDEFMAILLPKEN